MNAAQAAKQAAKQSKVDGQAFVVWVCDEGRAVYSAAQTKMWAALIQIEAAYLNGVQVSA